MISCLPKEPLPGIASPVEHSTRFLVSCSQAALCGCGTAGRLRSAALVYSSLGICRVRRGEWVRSAKEAEKKPLRVKGRTDGARTGKAVGDALRDAYDEAVNEAIPADLLELLKKL